MHFHYWGWFLTFDYVCTVVQKCFLLSLFALFEGVFRVYLKATRRHFRHFREQIVYVYFRKIRKERNLKEKLVGFCFLFFPLLKTVFSLLICLFRKWLETFSSSHSPSSSSQLCHWAVKVVLAAAHCSACHAYDWLWFWGYLVGKRGECVFLEEQW